MVVPSRKSRMIQNFMKIQESQKKEFLKEIKPKEVDPEEHKKRVEMLKKIGLIKKG